MKTIGFVFLAIVILISCENVEEKQTNNYPISEGCYEGYFEYQDTSYWYSVCFEKGKYIEWPSGGAMVQKSMGCLTVGRYSTQGNALLFVLDSYKFKDFPEPCTNDMLLPGRYEIIPTEIKDSLLFKKGTGANHIAYFLKKHEEVDR